MRRILLWTGITGGIFLLGLGGAFGYDKLTHRKITLTASVAESIDTIQNVFTPEPEVTLTFAGDIMLDRGVKTSVLKNFAGDYNQLFKNVNLFRDDDITFANFEGTATTKGYKTGSKYSFRMDPKVLTAVHDASIDIVSFANNHVGDYAMSGFTDTMRGLTEAGVPFTGAGTNYAIAQQPTIIEKNGVLVGYLGFTDVGPNWLAAKDTSAGILLASDPDFAGIIARAKSVCDVLVVSIHWGVEYQPHTEREAQLAHAAIDAGADIIAGTHPHVPQDLETYKNKLIIYSLGNFIFDQSFSPETMNGLVVQTTVTKSGEISDTKEFKSSLNKQYQVESIIEKEDRGNKSIHIGWVGDIPPSGVIPKFSNGVESLLNAPTLMVGNLEGALGVNPNTKCPTTDKQPVAPCYVFVGTNEYAAKLRAVGFDAMNIANNHTYDAGKTGVLDTKNILTANTLLTIGEIGSTVTRTIDGVPVALIGFGTNYWTDSLIDLDKVREHIVQIKQEYPIVIVFFHGGAEGETETHVLHAPEYYKGENRGDIYAFAHAAIDAGADLVLGSGPHVVRAVEKYKDRFIAYSAGNFLTTDGLGNKGLLGSGAIFNITLDGNGVLKNVKINSITTETKDAVSLDGANIALSNIISLTQQDIRQAISADAKGNISWD